MQPVDLVNGRDKRLRIGRERHRHLLDASGVLLQRKRPDRVPRLLTRRRLTQATQLGGNGPADWQRLREMLSDQRQRLQIRVERIEVLERKLAQRAMETHVEL